MKIKLFLIKNFSDETKMKWYCCELEVDGIAHVTYDLRHTYGDPEEITIVTSRSTVKEKNKLNDIADLIEDGTIIVKDIEVEPHEKEWRPHGFSYTLIRHKSIIQDA